MTQAPPPPPHRARKRRINYQTEIARLDALSRIRALTEPESIMLERMLWRVEKKGTRRAPYATLRELARAGMKRSQIPGEGP